MRWGAVALLLLAGASTALALSYTPQTPLTVARGAARVVIATIRAADPDVTPEGAEVDRLTLEVHETWSGAPSPATLRVRQVRTVLDAQTGVRAYIPGNPALAAGRTYLLFLPPETELPPVPLPVAGELGAFLATPADDGWRFRTLAGLDVLDVTAETWVVDSPTDPRLVHPVGHAPPPRPVRVRGLAAKWRALVRGVTAR